MAKNEILPFGLGVDANVMPQAEYESLPARVGGFSSGVAKSEQLNIVWRQAAFMASMLAQFIADNSEQDVLDDGKIAELQIKLESAIKSYANSNLPSASTIQKGIVQLSSATNSTSETLAATPKAVKAAIDAALPGGGTAKAAEKLATARKISGVDFDGTKDITLPFINTTDANIQLLGILSVLGSITSTNGHIIATNGNIACNNGNLYAGTGVASGLNVQATKSLIAGENLSVGGRGDITGDLRGGRVLSKSDVIVGEGQPGGHATINSTGNIAASQWGGGWLSTRTARAFAVFSGTSGAVSGSIGVTSVTRNAVGTYTIVFSSAMPGTYAVFVGTDTANRLDIHQPSVQSKTATSFQLLTSSDGGTSYGLTDLASVQIVVFSTGV
ncbi:tail fiber protein [Yersinia proxima]|uniref:tail fiber protein n=1 Tax=Yersinia proxima TaxID=2890316 RepID=UPI001D11DD7E|nr:phage tail protein [Yersinia proxima]